MKTLVTEMCSNCMNENTLEWDTEKEGYKAYCPHCGEKMMLCDECTHASDNEGGQCDYDSETEDVLELEDEMR